MAIAPTQLIQALVSSGLLSEKEANETERIVVDIQQGSLPVIYIKRFGDATVLGSFIAQIIGTADFVTIGGRTTAHEPGQTAYSAYRTAASGRSLVSGQPLPLWDDLPHSVREAWRASASAVQARGA